MLDFSRKSFYYDFLDSEVYSFYLDNNSDFVFLFSSLTRFDSCCDLYLALHRCHSCLHLSAEKVIQKK